jgi:hypothetical protein
MNDLMKSAHQRTPHTLFSRSKRSENPFVARGFVLVGVSEFNVRDLEHCATHATVVSPVELHDGMVGLAARSHELGILDRQQRLLEANKLVRLP